MVRTSGEYADKWAHDGVRAYLLGNGGPSLKAVAHRVVEAGLRGQELDRMLAAVRDRLQSEAPTKGKAIDKRYESLLAELQAQGLVRPA